MSVCGMSALTKSEDGHRERMIELDKRLVVLHRDTHDSKFALQHKVIKAYGEVDE